MVQIRSISVVLLFLLSSIVGVAGELQICIGTDHVMLAAEDHASYGCCGHHHDCTDLTISAPLHLARVESALLGQLIPAVLVRPRGYTPARTKAEILAALPPHRPPPHCLTLLRTIVLRV